MCGGLPLCGCRKSQQVHSRKTTSMLVHTLRGDIDFSAVVHTDPAENIQESDVHLRCGSVRGSTLVEHKSRL